MTTESVSPPGPCDRPEETPAGHADLGAYSPFDRLYSGNPYAPPPTARRVTPSKLGWDDLKRISAQIANPYTSDSKLLFLLSLRRHVLTCGQLTPTQRSFIGGRMR